MRKQYSTNDLKVGETAMVDMSITYSHIVKAYDISEIERKIASDTQAGRIAPDRNDAGRLREITGCDVNIHNASETFQKFLDERCYTSRKKAGSYFVNLRTKGNLPPRFAARDPQNPNVLHEFVPEGEFDHNLNVTLVLNVYRPKNSPNNGVGIQMVIVNEPVRYYKPDTFTQALASAGLTFEPMSEDDKQAALAHQDETYTAQQPAEQPETQQPVAPPVGNGFQNQPTYPQQTQQTNYQSAPPFPSGGITFDPRA